MAERHAIWQLLDRLQMDNRAQAAKLVELRAAVATLGLPEKDPPLPAEERIRRQIRNGALVDPIDVIAECNGESLPPESLSLLLSELKKRKEKAA